MRADQPAARPTSTRSRTGWPTWRTRGSTWSPSAASSPSAAASWTSSRPPTSTRPGSSSGATRSRRSAPSPSPTSAPSSRSTGCGRRRAASCCSPRRCAQRAAELAEAAPRAGRDPGQAGRGHPGRGHGVARPGAAGRHRLAWSCCSTACRRARTCCSATRSGSAPGRTTWSVPREEFLEASWAAAAVGGQAPIDVGAAAFKTLAEVRATAAALGQPWWSMSPFGLVEAHPGGRRPAVAGPGRADHGHPRRGRCRSRWPPSRSPLYHGETDRVVDDLKRLGRRRLGGRAGLRGARAGAARGRGAARRRARRRAGRDDRRRRRRPASCWSPAARSTTASSTSASRLAVLTGNDITGGRGASTRDMRKMPSRRRNTIDPLELRTGDYVVHEQHGIGRYVELVQRTVNGADREYLVIEYAAVQARPARRPALRAHRPARPAVPLRRRGDARRCTRWAAPSGRRPRPGPARRSARSPPS